MISSRRPGKLIPRAEAVYCRRVERQCTGPFPEGFQKFLVSCRSPDRKERTTVIISRLEKFSSVSGSLARLSVADFALPSVSRPCRRKAKPLQRQFELTGANGKMRGGARQVQWGRTLVLRTAVVVVSAQGVPWRRCSRIVLSAIFRLRKLPSPAATVAVAEDTAAGAANCPT